MNGYVEYYKSMIRFSMKLVHVFNNYWKDILEEYEINQTEFVFLGIVVESPGITQQQIVRQIGADKSIVSRNLNRLEKKKMVCRKPNKEFNHGYYCESTEKGMEVYRRIHEKGDPMIEETFSVASREEIEQARDTLMKIWGHMYEM